MYPLRSAQEEADEIISEFSFFDDWTDRYQHLIDQGRRLPQIRPQWQDEDHILKGYNLLSISALKQMKPAAFIPVPHQMLLLFRV